MSIKENKERKSSKLENKQTKKKQQQKKIQVMNQVSVKRANLNLFVDSMQSIDKLNMLVLSSAKKPGLP